MLLDSQQVRTTTVATLLALISAQTSAFAADPSCSALSKIESKLDSTPALQLPDMKAACERIHAARTVAEKEAEVTKLGLHFRRLDDPTLVFGEEVVTNLSTTEIEAVRMALRAIQYQRLFKNSGLTPEASYFGAASVMTIGLLNLQAGAAIPRHDANPSSPYHRHPIEIPSPSGGVPANLVSFMGIAEGNRMIFSDLGIRTALTVNCAPSDLEGVNVSRALAPVMDYNPYPLDLKIAGVNLAQTLEPANTYPIVYDTKECAFAMSTFASGTQKDIVLALVDCEQSVAQEIMYKIDEFPIFSLIVDNFSAGTNGARAPVEVEGEKDKMFISLGEYWKSRSFSGHRVLGNFSYRTPWLKQNMADFREVVIEKSKYDMPALLDKISRSAAFVLAPLEDESCPYEKVPFIIETLK